MMNMSGNYSYIENVGQDGIMLEDFETRISGDASRPDAPEKDKEVEKATYSKIWRGYYTPSQIEELEHEYANLEEDFVLDNTNIRDYARKVAKASFNSDIAYEKYRRGEIPFKEYKEAMELFDSLSKSANFAACRRKPGESTGLGTIGEIFLRVELSGELNTSNYDFPEDQVDAILNDLYHTVRSIGAQL